MCNSDILFLKPNTPLCNELPMPSHSWLHLSCIVGIVLPLGKSHQGVASGILLDSCYGNIGKYVYFALGSSAPLPFVVLPDQLVSPPII